MVHTSIVGLLLDDFTVSHLGLDVIQSTDYYPFGGLTENVQKENYRFGYQGQFAEEDGETGFNHFELRDYDPKIGRWMSPDPYGQFDSPYNGMGNNPVYLTDRNGGCAGDDIDCINAAKAAGFTSEGDIAAYQNLEGLGISASAPTTFEKAAFIQGLPFADRMLALGFEHGGKFNSFEFLPDFNESLNSTGTGVGLDFFIGPGVGVSLDRIHDNAGGNDLYLSFKGGFGADITADVHGALYDGFYNPGDIAGGFYFGSAGYGPLGYERAGSINFIGLKPILGDVNSNSVGLGVGTKYLVGGAKAGVGYTFNLSDFGRFFQGQKTRSYE